MSGCPNKQQKIYSFSCGKIACLLEFHAVITIINSNVINYLEALTTWANIGILYEKKGSWMYTMALPFVHILPFNMIKTDSGFVSVI